MSDIEKDTPQNEEQPGGTQEETAEETAAETPADEETAGNDGTEETAPGEQPSETDVLKEKIEALEKAAAADKDRYLRLLAEYDNFRKRSVQEKLNASADATAKAALEIISVTDNFERAVEAECSDENYKKGVEMIYGQFTEVIRKLGVEEIDALGKEFDPKFHNAVSQIEDEQFGENTVSQVYQKGYKLGDKVIRHAMVVVANP